MELIHKLVDCEVKKLNDLTYEFVASTEDIDRDGEVIEVAGWDLKNFKKNPVITFAHDYRSLPIGKSPKVWVSDGKLRNHVEFPAEGVYPFADTVRRLVEGGFLRTESVGFKPAPDSVVEEDGDGVKTPRRRYTKQELLEIAIVPVPSNPNALIEAKTKGIITEDELKELITKPEETENFIRIPVPKEEGKHEGHRIRTIDIDREKGIKALYCGQDKVIITYLFVKEGQRWTMELAQAWVREHGKMLETTSIKTVSQSEIADELDYLSGLISAAGLSEETLEKAQVLIKSIGGDSKAMDMAQMKRMHDMMADCAENANKAKDMVQSVMDDMKSGRSPGNDIPVEDKAKVTPEQAAEISVVEIGAVVAKELAVLMGKIS